MLFKLRDDKYRLLFDSPNTNKDFLASNLANLASDIILSTKPSLPTTLPSDLTSSGLNLRALLTTFSITLSDSIAETDLLFI